MKERIAFLDSAYLIALAIERDEWHVKATRWAKRAESGKWSFLTSWAVILEIGNALSRPQYREMAITILNDFFRDPTITVVPLSEPLLNRSVALFAEREDKAWSLTDCISFLVMEDAGINEALTPDEHFEQAGFQALLLREK